MKCKNRTIILILLLIVLIQSTIPYSQQILPGEETADQRSIGGKLLTPVKIIYTSIGPGIIWRIHGEYYVETRLGTYRLSGYGELISIDVYGSNIYYARISPITNTTVIAYTDLSLKRQPWRIEFKPMLNPAKITYQRSIIKVYGVEYKGDKSLLYIINISPAKRSIINTSLIDLGDIGVKYIETYMDKILLVTMNNELYILKKKNTTSYSIVKILLQAGGEDIQITGTIEPSRKSKRIYLNGLSKRNTYILETNMENNQLVFHAKKINGRYTIIQYDPLEGYFTARNNNEYIIGLTDKKLVSQDVENVILYREYIVLTHNNTNIYLNINSLKKYSEELDNIIFIVNNKPVIHCKIEKMINPIDVEAMYGIQIIGNRQSIMTYLESKSYQESIIKTKTTSDKVKLLIGKPVFKHEFFIENDRVVLKIELLLNTTTSLKPLINQLITLLFNNTEYSNVTDNNGETLFTIRGIQYGKYMYTIKWDKIQIRDTITIQPSNTTTTEIQQTSRNEQGNVPLIVEILIGVLAVLIITIIIVYFKYMRE